MKFSKFVAYGSYLPKKILTNKDLEQIFDTSDEWIQTRTGIQQRHIVEEGQKTSDLAYAASALSLRECANAVSAISRG